MLGKYLRIIASLFFITFSLPSFAQMAGQPEHSYVLGSNWYCDSGYQKSDNQCVSIFAAMGKKPDHSYALGSNWYCDSGYQKSDNQCISIFAAMGKKPEHSYALGSNWYCDSGFQKSGNQCVSIFAGVCTDRTAPAVQHEPVGATQVPPRSASAPITPACSESGSCYGDISTITGLPKTNYVSGYTKRDGTVVRGYYRSHR